MKPPVFSCLASRTTNNGSLYGRFLFGPLPVDISLTLATILRRSLLHIKAPFTIVSAEIEGATHEYAALPGIQESVLEILLNLGEVVLTRKRGNLLNSYFRSSFVENDKSKSQTYMASLRISGPCIVTAKDIYWPDGILCVKPQTHIATLSGNNTLAMRIKIIAAVNKNSTSSTVSNFSAYSYHQPLIDKNGVSKEAKIRAKNLQRSPIVDTNLSEGNLGCFCSAKVRIDSSKGSQQPLNRLEKNNEKGFFFDEQKHVKSTSLSNVRFVRSSQKFLYTWPYSLHKADSPGFSQQSTDRSTYGVGPSLQGPRQYRQKKLKYALRLGLKSAIYSSAVQGDIPVGDEASVNLRLTPGVSNGLTAANQLVNFGKVRGNADLSFEGQDKKIESGYNFGQLPLYESKSKVSEAANLGRQRVARLQSSHYEGNKASRFNGLAVSASFYPIEKVNFVIERDDQLVGYRHRIIFEVWTNGSISPRQAIFDSISWIIKLLYNFRESTAPFEIPL